MHRGSQEINEEPHLEDAQLVDRVARRDDTALGCIIARYGNQVLGLCEAISLDKADAESVTSDVFLELWNRTDAFDSARGTLRTYLLTLARCRSIDRRRSRVARETRMNKFINHASQDIAHYAYEETGESASMGVEKRKLVGVAMGKLPEAQRIALHMAFFLGLTHMEVAEKLSLPLGTVKSHIRRGLLHLKSELAEKFEVGEAG